MGIAIDPWVTRYEALRDKLKDFGIPNEKLDDPNWIINNIKRFKTNLNLKKYHEIVREISAVHCY